MPDRAPIELEKCYRLLNHGPTVLVSSAHAGARNVMSAAWSMPLDFMPPKVVVVIDKTTWTRELVEASGEFVLNVPTRALAETTLGVGSKSGRNLDKFTHWNIETLPAEIVGAPLIAGCLGWLECRVIPERHNRDRYDLFIGEVIAAAADPRYFRDGRWQLDHGTPPSIHYIAGGAFFETGPGFELPKNE